MSKKNALGAVGAANAEGESTEPNKHERNGAVPMFNTNHSPAPLADDDVLDEDVERWTPILVEARLTGSAIIVDIDSREAVPSQMVAISTALGTLEMFPAEVSALAEALLDAAWEAATPDVRASIAARSSVGAVYRLAQHLGVPVSALAAELHSGVDSTQAEVDA